MPVVEKTHGGRVTIRDIGEFEAGDRVDVSDDAAAYLCDERDDFARVDGPDTDESYPTESDGDTDGGVTDESADGDIIRDDPAVQIEAGECPWCDDYGGEHVGQHASSAHPDAWDDYKDAGEV